LDKLCGHVIETFFVSHEDMVKASLLWQLEEYRLENGPTTGYLHAVHTSHIQVGYSSRSRGVFYKGKTPKNAYVFGSVESDGFITHNGLRIYPDELVVLNDKDEMDYTTSSAAEILTFVIEKDFLETAFERYFNEFFTYDKIHKRIQLKENAKLTLKAKAIETLRALTTQRERLKNDLLFHDKTEDDILQILFQNIDSSKERNKTLESEIVSNEVREYIEMHFREDIAIEQTYSNKNYSDRMIRSRFKKLFGFSPKQYLKQYRLGKVHHALLMSDPKKATVAHIAYDHGFTHMSRFGNEYKSMFEKLPSTTLEEPYPSAPLY
jgi:AraC-like DNA-binding protein